MQKNLPNSSPQGD